MASWLLVLQLAVLAVTGCAQIGFNTSAKSAVDFGPPMTLNVCILQANAVSEARVDELVDAVNKEFKPYKIEVAVPWRHAWTRPGFTDKAILDDLNGRDLEPPCDRLVLLIDRGVVDILYGNSFGGEALAAVDDATRTHGLVVATRADLGQLITPPSAGAIHLSYTLLGCNSALTLTACYHDIARLKSHVDPTEGFIPGIDAKGQFIMSRAAVNARVRMQLLLDDLHYHDMALEQQHDLEWTADCQSMGTVTTTPKLRPTNLRRFRAVVCTCVNESGDLTQDSVITVSSGVPKVDAMALKLATAASGLYTLEAAHDRSAGSCRRTAMTIKETVSP